MGTMMAKDTGYIERPKIKSDMSAEDQFNNLMSSRKSSPNAKKVKMYVLRISLPTTPRIYRVIRLVFIHVVML